MKKVAIIVVNWNGKRLLKTCLEAVYKQTYKNFEVYFVDNGSEDDSVEFVEKNFPKTKVIRLKGNTGFAKGNNVGIRKALEDKTTEYIVCVNNDTKMEPKFLSNLVKKANENKKIGAVAPKMRFFYEPDLIDSVGLLINEDGGGLNRGTREIDKNQYDESEEVFGACGGAVLYKRKMLEDIEYKGEYFDDNFFAYYEDLDLAWRSRLRGWKTVTCPNAVIQHVHSATAISYSSFKAFYVNRNRFFVIIKNFSFFYLIKALFVLTPIRYLHLINSMRIKKGPSHKLSEKTGKLNPFKIVLKGWFSLLLNLPKMIQKRRFIQKNKKASNKEIKDWFEKYSANLESMIYK
jgi:hypothetical protein